MLRVNCNECGGHGNVSVLERRATQHGPDEYGERTCWRCGGTGTGPADLDGVARELVMEEVLAGTPLKEIERLLSEGGQLQSEARSRPLGARFPTSAHIARAAYHYGKPLDWSMINTLADEMAEAALDLQREADRLVTK